ncbi:hypothetical protein BSL78_01931 [Apostichopus japonicus]|uniref:Uncharacterized protein n=1 Tax=Stichopus japonicus TaxID=307972 RepID=A0A2G8LLH0_STIJA|nr:hypothetical protein BSL78_01931 [Apostichopus japonicus]
MRIDGLITTSASDGTGGNAGGGSGGSIFIKTTNFTGYGELNVNGGNGADSSQLAGSGFGGVEDHFSACDLDFWEIDEAHVTRYANVRFYTPPAKSNVTVIIHRFLGDKTGLLHLQIDQLLFVEVVESMTNESIAPISYRLDAGSEIVFPARVYLIGIRSEFGGYHRYP